MYLSVLMRKWVCYIGLLVGCMAFFPIASAQNTDIEWLRQINLERNQNFDPSYKFVSHTTLPLAVGLPFGILGTGLIRSDSTLIRKGIVMLASFGISSSVTIGLKYLTNRPRPFVTYPEIEKLEAVGKYSFPSGHTSSAFSVATSFSLNFPKWYIVTPSLLWAGAVGYSRMHLGVHYPSDVLMGAFVGSGSAFLCHWLNKKIHIQPYTRKIHWI